MASASKTVRTQPNQPLRPGCRSARALAAAGLAFALGLAAVPAHGAAAANRTAAATTTTTPAARNTQQATTTITPPSVRGSTSGLLTPAPIYAAGLQIGNYGGSGLSMQRLAMPGGGALNANLGILGGKIGASADYVYFASDQFHLLQLRPNSDYNQMRGQLLLWFGGGAGVQNGVLLRAPVGVQYTMLRDPITFYGGFALVIGPFFAHDSPGPQAWLSLGMRALL